MVIYGITYNGVEAGSKMRSFSVIRGFAVLVLPFSFLLSYSASSDDCINVGNAPIYKPEAHSRFPRSGLGRFALLILRTWTDSLNVAGDWPLEFAAYIVPLFYSTDFSKKNYTGILLSTPDT